MNSPSRKDEGIMKKMELKMLYLGFGELDGEFPDAI